MKKINANILLFVLLLSVLLVLKLSGLFDGLEFLWLDRLFAMRVSSPHTAPANESSPSPVTIISIPSLDDQEKKYSAPGALKALYIKAISLLKKNDARVIAIDFLSQSSEFDQIKPSDIGGAKCLVMPITFLSEGKNLILLSTQDQASRKLTKTYGLMEASNTSKMRWLPMQKTINKKEYYHFILEILVKYYKVEPEEVSISDGFFGSAVTLGEQKRFPLQRKNRYFINYYMSSVKGMATQSNRYFNVYRMDQLLAGQVPPKALKNAIVILGSLNPLDRYFSSTPVGFLADSEIYAQALYSIIKGPRLTFVSSILYFILFIVVGYLLFLHFVHARERKHALYLVLCAFGCLFLSALLFFTASVYLEIFPFLFLMAGLLLLRITVSREEQQDQLDSNIETFKAVAEKLLENKDSENMGPTLLQLMCQPLNLMRGVLVLLREGKTGAEDRDVYYYPQAAVFISADHAKEIDDMLLIRKPVIATSSLVIPFIHANGTHFGVLKLQKKSFTTQELQMMMVLSHISFISIYNMRLTEKVKKSERLQHEAELAADIQKALLAEKAPAMRGGVSMASRCIPASEVGGDYLDFITHQEGIVGIAVGDVTGHGMGAAIIMGLLRSVLRSQASQSVSPAEIVTSINNILYNDFVSFSKMASLFYGTYSSIDKTMTFTNAGQTPPILIRASELNARVLRGKNPILGFRSNIRYKEFRIKIYPGDIIIFLTDGIVEAENSSREFYGQEQVEKVVNDNVDRTAQEILDAIFDDVEKFTEGQPQKDDMTLIVMKV